MKQFIVEPGNLEKWLYQNKAEYTGLFYDGCLLDNFAVITKNGAAGIYEKYVNPNQSTYLIEFNRDVGFIISAFMENRERVLAEYPETF